VTSAGVSFASRRVAAAVLACLAILPVQAGIAEAGWQRLVGQNRPLAAVRELERSPELAQLHAQVSVFIGDEAPSCGLSGRLVLPDDVEYRDALPVIAELARDRRVVMLNESHFRGVHRAFLARVVALLDGLGFDALAAETFTPAAPERLRASAPGTDTGFYLADPLFAAAVREARALGWEFVHYEADTTHDRESREAGQAHRLAEWLAAHPGRRLLVHAGGSHVSEAAEAGWMAARLAAATGLDPLTVRQAATACPGQAGAWPVDADEALVPFREGRPLAVAGTDLAVVHPPAAVEAARQVLGAPVVVCVPAVAQDSLLRAFGEADAPLAIAHDQRLLAAGADRVRLHLRPGRYRIEREDADGRHPLGRVEVADEGDAACLRPVP
jgi:hypothetical protein